MTQKKITIKDYHDLYKKYGDLGIKVRTPYGYKKINGCDITEKNGKILKVILEDGSFVEGSFNHKVKTKNGRFVVLSNLKIGQEIQTINGCKKITTILNEGLIEDLYDIEVDDVKQYYTNNIVSHNSVLSVDLSMFLFFNETTKTTKAEEIFNRFTDKNKVYVKGEITIDGEEYVIIRKIERKKSKSGDWTVKTDLDFFKKLSDGSLQNFTGEQRKETENFIKNSIGTKEDFLMTILTTSSNLEELIDSKPTARGQVLSRFMGLDFLKRKEEYGKELYSEFSSTMISKVYNSEKLKQDNETYENKILELTNEKTNLQEQIVTLQDRIIKGQQYRDNLLKNKHTDIDKEISLLSPDKLKSEMSSLTVQKNGVERQLLEVKVIEPSSYYYEDEHDKIREEIKGLYEKKVELSTKIKSIEELKNSVDGGIKCEHCGIELMNATITQSKISELDGYISHYNQIDNLMSELSDKEQSFVKLKKEFDEYEKNKLIKEKYEISVDSYNLKINTIKDKLSKYEKIQDKIRENESLESQLIKSKMKIDELEYEKNNLVRKIDSNDYQISSMNDKIKDNIKLISRIEKESEKETLYKLYLEIFGKNGITKSIMRTMIPIINSELQRLLEDSCHFRLEIRINEKNEVEFVMIDNNTQIEKLMVSGSGYERTIASLALRSVLTKICSLPKPNIIVMDEVFGKVSNENLDMVGEFFIKIKEYFDKVLIISHNPLINNWADSLIKIKKIDNISYIYQ